MVYGGITLSPHTEGIIVPDVKKGVRGGAMDMHKKKFGGARQSSGGVDAQGPLWDGTKQLLPYHSLYPVLGERRTENSLGQCALHL